MAKKKRNGWPARSRLRRQLNAGGELTSFAWFVSRVFDPVIEIPFLLGMASIYALASGWHFRYLVFLLLIDAVVPALYMIWGLIRKTISDWDITNKDERRGLYFFTIFAHLFGVVYAFMLGKEELAEILFVFWMVAVVFGIVTYFWKISTHTGVNGVALAFFNHFYGWKNYWWMTVVLIIVIWARVKIKKHTVAQAVSGAIIAVAIVEFGLRAIGM